MLRSIMVLAMVFTITHSAFAQNSLSLQQIWNKAIEHYPSVKSKVALIKQLEAEKELIRNQRLPEFRLQAQQNFGIQDNIPGSFFPLAGNFNVSGLGKDANDHLNSTGLVTFGSGVLELPVYQFGRINKRISAADAALQTGQALKEEEEFALKLAVARLYFQMAEEQSMLDVMAHEEERLMELLEHTRVHAEAGLIPGADTSIPPLPDILTCNEYSVRWSMQKLLIRW